MGGLQVFYVKDIILSLKIPKTLTTSAPLLALSGKREEELLLLLPLMCLMLLLAVACCGDEPQGCETQKSTKTNSRCTRSPPGPLVVKPRTFL